MRRRGSAGPARGLHGTLTRERERPGAGSPGWQLALGCLAVAVVLVLVLVGGVTTVRRLAHLW